MAGLLWRFNSEQEALDWMIEQANDPCIDNERIGYEDDPESMEQYATAAQQGCCGSAHYEVVIGEHLAVIGCNFGH